MRGKAGKGLASGGGVLGTKNQSDASEIETKNRSSETREPGGR